MNKIEELEKRLHALESLLGIESAVAEVDREFWDPNYNQIGWAGVPTKVVYRCRKGHDHDTIPEAKVCTEQE